MNAAVSPLFPLNSFFCRIKSAYVLSLDGFSVACGCGLFLEGNEEEEERDDGEEEDDGKEEEEEEEEEEEDAP